jgi:hypothetical protein
MKNLLRTDRNPAHQRDAARRDQAMAEEDAQLDPEHIHISRPKATARGTFIPARTELTDHRDSLWKMERELRGLPRPRYHKPPVNLCCCATALGVHGPGGELDPRSRVTA